MDLYQDCSYDVPGVKTGPAPGVTSSKQEQRRKTLKFFFSETKKCRVLIFGMKHLLVDLYQDCSYDAPGVKTGLAPGVTSSKHRNKDGKLQNSSFLKLEGVEVWYLVCGISYWTCTKIVHMMPLRSKLAPPWESQVQNIQTNKENFKILL